MLHVSDKLWARVESHGAAIRDVTPFGKGELSREEERLTRFAGSPRSAVDTSSLRY